jgi:hypothetical protein
MKIAFTSRSVAALPEKDLANRRPPMASLITTLGGIIAAVCSRCQSQRNYEFAMDRSSRPLISWAMVGRVFTFAMKKTKFIGLIGLISSMSRVNRMPRIAPAARLGPLRMDGPIL